VTNKYSECTIYFFFKLEFPQATENVAVRLETTTRSGRSGVRVTAGEKFIFFFQIVKTDSGTRLTSNSIGTGFFPGLKRSGSEADRLSPSRSEVKNEWSIPLPSLCYLMAWKGTNVTFPLSVLPTACKALKFQRGITEHRVTVSNT
jgi:hypothetical protein